MIARDLCARIFPDTDIMDGFLLSLWGYMSFAIVLGWSFSVLAMKYEVVEPDKSEVNAAASGEGNGA